MGMCRTLGYDKVTRRAIFDRIGYWQPGICWLPTGAGEQLFVPEWIGAVPAFITEAQGSTGAKGYDSKVIGPLAVPALKQSRDARLGDSWVKDPGLLLQPGALPLALELPVDFPVTALSFSTMDEQQLALIPSGGILVAVYNSSKDHGKFGTKVFDIKKGALDTGRWARDHSHWVVYLLPVGARHGFDFGGGGAPPPHSPPGGLAWLLGPDVEDRAGHGVFCDLPSAAGTPLPTQDPRYVTRDYKDPKTGGLVPGAPSAGTGYTTGIGNGLQGYGAPGTTQEKPKPVNTDTDNNPTSKEREASVYGVATYRGWGPFDPGGGNCPHELNKTGDGKSVCSGHIRETALIRGGTGDAPNKYDGNAWVKPAPDGPFALEAYRRVDGDEKHKWMDSEVAGLRKIQVMGYMDVPVPANDPRPGEQSNPGTKEKFPGPKPKPGPKPGPDPKPDPKPDPNPGPDPIPPVIPPDVGPQYIGPDHLIKGYPVGPATAPPGEFGPNGPVPPGGYFDGNGRPLYPEPGEKGSPFVNPANQPLSPPPTGAAPPNDQVGGVIDSPPQQKCHPAMGPALGISEIIPRAASIASNHRDSRYQFDQYTADERRAYDNAPAGAKITAFSERVGGAPTYDGPQCGPGGMATGTSPRGGVAICPSDLDLNDKLRNEREGRTTRRPTNEALVTFEERADAAWGDTNEAGKPRNGFRMGRFYDPDTGTKLMSIDETDNDGNLVSEIPAVLIDFVSEVVELWGVPIPMVAGGGNGSVNRKPTANVTVADGYSLVVADYYDIGSFTLSLEGDAVLGIV